jgi:GH35 family endo-1,4-beta-xylanase
VRLSALGEARYRDTFQREFNSLTPENELKMDALQPRGGGYDFAAADKLVRFARRNGKAVRGHTLIWGQALPLWLVDHGALGELGLRLPPIALPPCQARSASSSATRRRCSPAGAATSCWQR